MSEYNVCGVLVMSKPESVPMVEATLNAIEGVEVHASDNGKLVVTVEGPNNRDFANMISDFSNIDGVLSTSMVYHQIETEEVPNKSSNETVVSGQELTQ